MSDQKQSTLKTLLNPKAIAAYVAIIIIVAGAFGVVSQTQVNVSLQQLDNLQDQITALQNQLDQPVGSTLSAMRKSCSFIVSFATNNGVPDRTLVLQSGVNGSMITLGNSATNYTYIAELAINLAHAINGSIYFCEGNYVTALGVPMTVPTIPLGVTVTFDSGAYGYILGAVQGTLNDYHNNIFYVAGQTEQAPYNYLIYVDPSNVNLYHAKASNESIVSSSADASIVFQAAINAVGSSGGKIVFAAGNYTALTPVTEPYPNVFIQGAGDA